MYWILQMRKQSITKFPCIIIWLRAIITRIRELHRLANVNCGSIHSKLDYRVIYNWLVYCNYFPISIRIIIEISGCESEIEIPRGKIFMRWIFKGAVLTISKIPQECIWGNATHTKIITYYPSRCIKVC